MADGRVSRVVRNENNRWLAGLPQEESGGFHTETFFGQLPELKDISPKNRDFDFSANLKFKGSNNSFTNNSISATGGLWPVLGQAADEFPAALVVHAQMALRTNGAAGNNLDLTAFIAEAKVGDLLGVNDEVGENLILDVSGFVQDEIFEIAILVDTSGINQDHIDMISIGLLRDGVSDTYPNDLTVLTFTVVLPK